MTSSHDAAYDERLVVPWWWWLGGLSVTALIAAEIHGGAPGLRSVLPYAIGLPLIVVLLAIGSRAVSYTHLTLPTKRIV